MVDYTHLEVRHEIDESGVDYVYIYILLLVGGIPTPLKTMSESQLG
jgi:hypothetical protein